MYICDKKDCTGCSACLNICPQKAITMVGDELGKRIPFIDDSLCTKCGLCVKACPNNNIPTVNRPRKCYALWTKEPLDQATCSSGGVATTCSRYILEEGGIVFGATFCNDGKVRHTLVENEEKLEELKGSKYTESEIGHTFRKAHEYLKQGRRVLFIATPCQIQGLKQFLRKEYELLITMDLICHGTPPDCYLNEYLEGMKLQDIDNLTFRGRKDYYFSCYKDGRTVYSMEYNKDRYFLSFLSYLIQRDNCYSCKYANLNRVSDVTVGDFWGLDKESLKVPYTGKISVGLVNTLKGEEFFKRIRDLFYYEERQMEEAIRGNEQLSHPPVKHKDRERFEKAYKKHGFMKAINHTNIPYQIRKNKIKGVIKNLLNKQNGMGKS